MSWNTDSAELDAPIWGIENFAKIINRTQRATYHLVANGRPGVRYVAAKFCRSNEAALPLSLCYVG